MKTKIYLCKSINTNSSTSKLFSYLPIHDSFSGEGAILSTVYKKQLKVFYFISIIAFAFFFKYQQPPYMLSSESFFMVLLGSS